MPSDQISVCLWRRRGARLDVLWFVLRVALLHFVTSEINHLVVVEP